MAYYSKPHVAALAVLVSILIWPLGRADALIMDTIEIDPGVVGSTFDGKFISFTDLNGLVLTVMFLSFSNLPI